MKLTKRQALLASSLLKQKGYQTIKHYAKQLSISERTVHSDLKAVAVVLLQEGYLLKKRPGVGIALQKVEVKESSVPQKIESQSNDYSTAGRRKRIMELLLFENRTVTFEWLSEMFLISPTSINNDFKVIKKKLTTGNQLHLVSDSHGTKLQGTELDFQKAYLEFNRCLVAESSNHLMEANEEQSIQLLNSYYGFDVVRVCSRVLYDYIKKEVVVIAEHYVVNVLNMLIILVYRILAGYHLEGSFELQDRNEKVFFEASAKEILEKISLRLDFSYTYTDVAYLSMYLITNRFEPLPTQQQYHDFILKIIGKVSESLKIDFTKDTKLKEQLLLHIPPMVYRLMEGIQTTNPFIDQIKNEFSLVFNLIWVVLSEYEEELKVRFNEAEIGFLTIYFQSAIERAKLSKKILIVCPTGIATSELLLNRIKNVLPSFDMIEVASIREIDEEKLADIDFVISTVQLEVKDKKVIVVSPILSDQDIKNISTIYNEKFVLSKGSINSTGTLSVLPAYLDNDFIYLKEEFRSKEELLTEIGRRLLQADRVTEEFVTSILNREQLGGTDLQTGVAIPHSNPKYVKKTVIVVVTNKKALKWTEYSVKTVLLVCIAKEDTAKIKGILSDIYQLVENKELVQQLAMAATKGQLRQRIGCEQIE